MSALPEPAVAVVAGRLVGEFVGVNVVVGVCEDVPVAIGVSVPAAVVGVNEGEALAVGVLLSTGVGVRVGVFVSVSVDVGVLLGLGVPVAVSVAVDVLVGVVVRVVVAVNVEVAVTVGVLVGRGVSVWVGVSDGVEVAEGDGLVAVAVTPLCVVITSCGAVVPSREEKVTPSVLSATSAKV